MTCNEQYIKKQYTKTMQNLNHTKMNTKEDLNNQI